MKKKLPAALRALAAFALAAAVLLTIPAAGDAAGRKFSCSNADEARQLALDCLMTCGFSTEYASDGTQGKASNLTRWKDSINIYVCGSPKQQDLAELDKFIMECATHCPNMPNIRVVNSEKKANITLWYGPLKEMKDHSALYVEGNWGFFSYWTDGEGNITRAEIAIASDVNTQASKNHLLREELVGAFGLSNDHFVFSDSILYGEWTTTPQLSDVDWLMLNMLYDRDLKPGMSAAQAREILEKKIAA